MHRSTRRNVLCNSQGSPRATPKSVPSMRSTWHIVPLILVLLLPSIGHSHDELFIVSDWRQPAFGIYDFNSSWDNDIVPTGDFPASDPETIVHYFGAYGVSLTTVNTQIAVNFLVDQPSSDRLPVFGEWFVSGAYDYRFGNPDITHRVDQVVVGDGDSVDFQHWEINDDDLHLLHRTTLFAPDLPLPDTALLEMGVPEAVDSPGTLITKSVIVGGHASEGEVARSGLLRIKDPGTLWRNEWSHYFFDVTIGGIGNTGRIEVLSGADFINESSTWVVWSRFHQ